MSDQMFNPPENKPHFGYADIALGTPTADLEYYTPCLCNIRAWGLLFHGGQTVGASF